MGLPEQVQLGGRTRRTAIRKSPVSGPLRLTQEGFAGDGVADRKHHGGPDKAVCVYSAAHYPTWERELTSPLPSAAFGENLTVEALDESALCLGDVLTLGEAQVQVSQPRQPCRTLALRLGQPDLIQRVIQTGRSGLYLRVLQEGAVRPTDELVLREPDPRRVTVRRALRVRLLGEDGESGLREVLAVPALSRSWRTALQQKLQRPRETPST